MAKKEKRIVIGNWKSNPATLEAASALLSSLEKTITKPKSQVIVCPPAVYPPALLRAGKKNKTPFAWGAQNSAAEKIGSNTGEIGPSMLASAGFSYALVGHSERRALGETDAAVARKAALAVKEGLRVVVCVGELARDEHGEYLQMLERQVAVSVPTLSRRLLDHLIIAYEPVWAIGENSKGVAAPGDVFETAILIRKILSQVAPKEFAMKVPLLYGGSVAPENARDLIAKGGVQGLLVGRDSLDAERFAAIIREVDAA